MVNLQLNIKISELIAATDSVVEVILNNEEIASLNSQKCSYSNQLMLSEKNNHLIIRRKYTANNIHKTGFMKQLMSSIVSLALFSCAFIEPFECLCECQDDYEVCFDKENAKMEINCSFNEGDFYPTFHIKCNECDLSSRKTVFVSDEELKNTFNERRKMIQSWILLSSIVFLVFIITSIIYMKVVTMIFSTVIFLLFIFGSFYSLKNLKKQCLYFKEKFNNRLL